LVAIVATLTMTVSYIDRMTLSVLAPTVTKALDISDEYALVTSDLLARMPAGSVSFAGGILAGAQSLALIIANPLIGRAVDRIGNFEADWPVVAAMGSSIRRPSQPTPGGYVPVRTNA
jgi:MFS family permease